MAFNNGFPMAYQPFYGNQGINYQQPMQTPPQGQIGGITWVSGEAGAKAYLVGPNQTVQLWDSESPTIYLKSADASGMPTMKILDYTIREQNSQPTSALMQSSDYVTHDELSAFEERITKMIKGGNDNESAF